VVEEVARQVHGRLEGGRDPELADAGLGWRQQAALELARQILVAATQRSRMLTVDEHRTAGLFAGAGQAERRVVHTPSTE